MVTGRGKVRCRPIRVNPDAAFQRMTERSGSDPNEERLKWSLLRALDDGASAYRVFPHDPLTGGGRSCRGMVDGPTVVGWQRNASKRMKNACKPQGARAPAAQNGSFFCECRLYGVNRAANTQS